MISNSNSFGNGNSMGTKADQWRTFPWLFRQSCPQASMIR